jgi:hypothetical protein
MNENRQLKVDRFFLAAKAGAIAWALSLSLYLVLIALGKDQATGWSQINYAILLFCFAALIVQFRNRNADEFTQMAWAGASTGAFLLTLGWMIFAIQLEYFINLAMWQMSGTPVRTAFAYWWAFQMPFTAFYAVFWLRQWRSC